MKLTLEEAINTPISILLGDNIQIMYTPWNILQCLGIAIIISTYVYISISVAKL